MVIGSHQEQGHEGTHPGLDRQPWDVIVVGGGAAGLMACLELPAQLRVLLLSKDSGPPSASRWAQGGIAAVTSREDSFASHHQDTIAAGAGLCDPQAVSLLVHEAPGCVQRLLELGMAFDREGGGDQLSTTLEAAHSHRRVLHAQDRRCWMATASTGWRPEPWCWPPAVAATCSPTPPIRRYPAAMG